MAAPLDSKAELRLIYNLPILDLDGIGLELGISQNTLSVIQKNNYGNEASRKREILGQWLRQDIKASYRKLAEVLNKHDPPEMESIEKLAKNLRCSVDALIPPGQSVAAPSPAPLKPPSFPRQQSKPAPQPLLESQRSANSSKTSVEAGMGHMLNPEDVDSLFGIVKGAKAKWRDIGRELGFTLKEMDEIVQKKGISQDQDYFQELLDLWLNWAPPQRPFPCTEDLLDALRRIGQHRLALTLENTDIIMGMKTLVTRGLQPNPTFTTVSGITAATKPITAPGNGLVAIAVDSLHTGIKAPSEPPKEPRNGSVPIDSNLPPTEDTDSNAPRVETDSGELKGSTGTPHLKIKEIKNDRWVVGAGVEAYKMDKDIHGIALIISNTEFEKHTGYDYRYGGDKDEQALQELFEMLHYKTVLLKNLKAAQIERALKMVTGDLSFDEPMDHEDTKKLENLKANDCCVSPENDSFVLCVMSHGAEGEVVLGTDGIQFTLTKIYEIFGNCKLLSKKPKMVFIQACRGSYTCVAQKDGPVKNPADFFLSFSTFAGHAAYREGNGSGSWYVKDLCSVLKESYITTDLDSMIIKVHSKLQDRSDKDEDGNTVKQVPEKKDTLKFRVYFQLKEPQSIS